MVSLGDQVDVKVRSVSPSILAQGYRFVNRFENAKAYMLTITQASVEIPQAGIHLTMMPILDEQHGLLSLHILTCLDE